MDDPPTALQIFEYPLSVSWVFIVISMCLSAFFSGIEIAFISANKLRIELRAKQGFYTDKILSRYVKNPSAFISTTLVANSIGLVVYGIFMGDVLNGTLMPVIHSEFLRYIIVTVISTIFILITAEFLPKSLFRINPDLILSALIIPFQFFYFLLWPFVSFIVLISKLILRIFSRQSIGKIEPVFSKVDLDHYISQADEKHLHDESDVDAEMFRNALDFGNIRLRDCMIPRTELVALDEESSIEELTDTFVESAHSKVLIYRENIDNIVGYIHLTELFSKPKDIKSVLMPIIVASDATPAQELLRELIRKRRSMAVVVDEFGGTAGIVAIEDIMEEIFGEIEDEHDVEHLKETTITEGRYIFSGRLEVYYLNEKYDLTIPEGDYTTLGGYIISLCESIPKSKEIIRDEKLEFLISKVRGARIEEVEVRVLA